MQTDERREQAWSATPRTPEQKAARAEDARLWRIGKLAAIEELVFRHGAQIYADWFGVHSPEADRKAFQPYEVARRDEQPPS
jgi:hypothetical protein